MPMPDITTPTCMRCGAFLPTRKDAWGWLKLCSACPLEPACGEFAHTYVAANDTGLWVCIRCGATMGSTNLSTTPVSADPPHHYDIYC